MGHGFNHHGSIDDNDDDRSLAYTGSFRGRINEYETGLESRLEFLSVLSASIVENVKIIIEV